MRRSTSRTAAVRAPIRAAVVVLLAALCTVVLGAGTATADEVPWSVRTASNDLGSDRPNYSYALNPGGRIEDALVVANRGSTPLDLAVYAADGFTTGAGKLDLLTKDARSTGVGAWVHASRDHVAVAPGASVEVPFVVTVPTDAAPGDHLGGIVTSLTQAGMERRVGMRVRLRVGGQLKPGLSVEDLRVRYSGTPSPFGKGDATLTYTIHNTGNAILAARQTASLSGPFGRLRASAGQIDDSPQLLPGEVWKVTASVHDVTPTVRLTATVTVVPLLTDAAGSIAPLAAADTTTHEWAVSWTLLLLVAVLGGIVAAGLTARRRRRHKSHPDASAREPDEPALHQRETSDQ